MPTTTAASCEAGRRTSRRSLLAALVLTVALLADPVAALPAIDPPLAWVPALPGSTLATPHLALRPDGSGLAIVTPPSYSASADVLVATADRGMTWTPRTAPFTAFTRALAVDGDATAYAISGRDGVLRRSSDDGRSWTDVPLPDHGTARADLRDVVATPDGTVVVSRTVFPDATCTRIAPIAQLLISADGRGDWQVRDVAGHMAVRELAVTAAPAGAVTADGDPLLISGVVALASGVAMRPDDSDCGDLVGGRLLTSADGGQRYTDVAPCDWLTCSAPVWLDPDRLAVARGPDVVVVDRATGQIRASDTASGPVPTFGEVDGLVVTAGVLYAVTADGQISRSDDGGRTFTVELPNQAGFANGAIAAFDPDVVLASTPTGILRRHP